jgi:hypothetical protein
MNRKGEMTQRAIGRAPGASSECVASPTNNVIHRNDVDCYPARLDRTPETNAVGSPAGTASLAGFFLYRLRTVR